MFIKAYVPPDLTRRKQQASNNNENRKKIPLPQVPNPLSESKPAPNIRATHSPPQKPINDSDWGKFVSRPLCYKGRTYGKESILRYNTTKQLKLILTCQKREIEKQLDVKGQSDPELIARYHRVVNHLSNVSLSDNTWQSSMSFRKALYAQMPPDSSHSPMEAHANYAKLCKTYAPGVVNLRLQQIEGPDGATEMLRSGMLTDLRNGFSDITEMREILRNERAIAAGQKIPKSAPTLCSKTRELAMLEAKLSKAGQWRGVGAIRYAQAQFLNTGALEAAIADREEVLDLQMLSLLRAWSNARAGQFAQLEDGSTVPMLQLSLLNRKNKSVDKSGWAHFEALEMREMAALFDQYHGKTLIFDGSGPFIDENGAVHMPTELNNADGDPKRLKLATFFANVSIQGHLENDGIQAEINQTCEQRLREYFGGKLPIDLAKAFAGLRSGESSYKIAKLIGKAALDYRFLLGINCASGKDRTGLICGLLTIAYLAGNTTRLAMELSLDILRKTREKLKRRIYKKDSAQTRVVIDNTGQPVLKLSLFRLPGMPKGLVGFFKRIGYLAKQLFAVIRETRVARDLDRGVQVM